MDKPPTKAKPSAEPDDTPEPLDADLRRAVLQAAETCGQRFDESPSRHAFQLSSILEVLGRYPHLIDPVHRFLNRKDGPSRVLGAAPILTIAGVANRRHGWEGLWMVEVTRWAIEEFNADPLDVVTVVVRHLLPMVRADCADAKKGPEQIGLSIKGLLIDDGTRRKQGWRDPEAVLRAILRELGHPRPDNLTRG